ncbi:BatA domain-containing protein [uncultured Kriegella sp.]|uniref:BatA domain-containing protein n=1 Tax=uncultured Kriegella sp. TaxID=1798910 RepID=UPI0030DB1EE2|tara:strand:- start:227230 stop:229152 length:1923 start_codon:yes stop_codon:yes gene_type:complete
MAFKHPELLWGLLLLLIPVLIHLFQLRRFKKTPFTNVKLLQKVQAASRRSKTLKKWLLLITRLSLLSALVLAFAQPFFAANSALQEKETIIYLDDSFSMQAKIGDETLLQHAVQELIKQIPKDQVFNLFTNKKVFKDVTLNAIQNELLSLTYSPDQLKLNEIYLKAGTFLSDSKNSVKNLILISDFQGRHPSPTIDSVLLNSSHYVQLLPDKTANVSIDSVFFAPTTTENIEVNALLSEVGAAENVAVSLFNEDKLIAKTSAVFNVENKAEVTFSLPKNEPIRGEIEISDVGLTYDNQFYFNIDEKEKIKVLAIKTSDNNYLERIFSEDEFIFSSFTLKNLDYKDLPLQNLIILDELATIPTSLTTSIHSFTDDGGSLILVPNLEIDITAYNQLTSSYSSSFFANKNLLERNITGINFSHPLYQNVFEKNVSNFQYPKVSSYYTIKTTLPTALSFDNKDPFLVGNRGLYIFTAPLSIENSNFQNSPLIVPSFYNIGQNSLKLNQLYYILGNSAEIDIPVQLTKDNILHVSKGTTEFIPRQRSMANKVRLSFDDAPYEDGIYEVMHKEISLKSLSFNYARNESRVDYLDLADISPATRQESVASVFQDIQNDNRIRELWKWFVILAIVFILMEVLIQRFLK